MFLDCFRDKMQKKKMKKNERDIIAVLCMLTGLICRMAYCIRYPVQPRDSYKYEWVIALWEETGEISDQITFFPLSLWILKTPYHLFRYDIMKGGIIINILLGVLIIFFSVIIADRIFENKYVVACVGLLVATHPMLVRFSCTFLRENTYLFFSVIAFSCFFHYYIRPKFFSVFLCSLFSALAFLCRLESLEVFAIFAVVIGLLLCKRKIKLGKAVCHTVFFSFMFLITIAGTCLLLGFNLVEFRSIISRFYIEETGIN